MDTLNKAKEIYLNNENEENVLIWCYKDSLAVETAWQDIEMEIGIGLDASIHNFLAKTEPEYIELEHKYQHEITSEVFEELQINPNHKYLDYIYQTLLTDFIAKNRPVNSDLFDFCENFYSEAKSFAKYLIDDLLNSEHETDFKLLKLGNLSIFINNQMIYYLADSEISFKLLKKEFSSSKKISETILNLKEKHQNFDIRSPLTFLIDYKCFRVLVMTLPPFDSNKSLVYGVSKHNQMVSNSDICFQLSTLLDEINISFKEIELGDAKNELFEVYKSKGYINELNYILKVNGLYKYGQLTTSAEISYKRPEILVDFNRIICQSDDSEKTLIEFQKLIDGKICILLEKYEELVLIPIDSNSLKQSLHHTGINLKYIGKIANQTMLPHIREICVIEIISRTCKRFFRQKLSDISFTKSQVNLESSLEHAKEYISEKTHYKKILDISKFKNDYKLSNFEIPSANDIETNDMKIESEINIESVTMHEYVSDYFNLIFGNSDESSKF